MVDQFVTLENYIINYATTSFLAIYILCYLFYYIDFFFIFRLLFMTGQSFNIDFHRTQGIIIFYAI